jgi:alkanesulfonate monooxygenase SsuD/methylene tetrahydromethanopterin reductase-like flavin-dependent oxidoreductase (luciferase family)
MQVGIGLPTTTPGATGGLIVEWARRAEQGPFTSLGVVDRIVYESLDPMLALAAAAAVTSEIRLVAMVLIGPIRNTALLAKEAASLDVLSGGRFTLGVAIGAREEDYEAVGVDPTGRGARLSEQLAELRATWEGTATGPRTVTGRGPTLLVGGAGGAAMLRMAQSADGYVHGGGPPRAFASAAGRALAAWEEAERPGRPQLWGQAYFALGDPDAGLAYMRDYYAFTGSFAERIARGTLTTPQAVKDLVRGYADAGCDEVVLFPTVSDLGEVDLLAEALS